MSLRTDGPRSRKGREDGPYFVAGSGDSANVVYRRDGNPATVRIVVAHTEAATLIASASDDHGETWTKWAAGRRAEIVKAQEVAARKKEEAEFERLKKRLGK